eukprot:642353-Hanusia_phi.AAC.8
MAGRGWRGRRTEEVMDEHIEAVTSADWIENYRSHDGEGIIFEKRDRKRGRSRERERERDSLGNIDKYDQVLLAEDLQSSYRWAEDPLIVDAFKKCASGLISCASKLVSPELLAKYMEDHCIAKYDIRPQNIARDASQNQSKSEDERSATTVEGDPALWSTRNRENRVSKGGRERVKCKFYVTFSKNHAPTVLFFDEIDALGISRNGAESDHSLRRLMAELLLQFNTLKTSDRVTVLAATNRIQDIDPALLRRFERKVEIGLLNQNDRARLLLLKLGDTHVASDVDIEWVAERTEGFSGADLELLCREASMFSVRELLQDEQSLLQGNQALRPVEKRDFVMALEAISPDYENCQRSKRKLKKDEEEMEQISASQRYNTDAIIKVEACP